MLTYDDFLEKARRLALGDPKRPSCVDSRTDLGRLVEGENAFVVRWRTGGMDGGNCWNDGARYEIDADPAAELTGLVTLLEDLDVRLREAKQILDLEHLGTYSESGYYGNHENFQYRYLRFDEVYEKLVEFGYAEPRTDADPQP